ncbi:NYN domain-containing protein [Corynebacterium sanguinis]
MNAIKATQSQSTETPRRLILIDIENFNGLAVQSAAQAKWCKKMLTFWLDIQEGEIVIIATDSSGLFNVNAGWKGPRLLVGNGANGADRRLIDEIEHMNFGQFDEIALVSGDGIFADPVARAAEHGIPTTVYSHGVQLSKRLRLAAAQVHLSENGYAAATSTPTPIVTQTNNVIQLNQEVA